MFDPRSVRFRGPLAPHAPGFWRELLERRYSALYVRNLLYVAARFSRWLDDRSVALGDVTDQRVATFLAHERRRGCALCKPTQVRLLLGYLRGRGVVPIARPRVATSPTDRFLREYAEYLARERALSAATIRGYSDVAREFIATRRDGLRWDRLRPGQISAFVLREARRWSVGHCKYHVTALRSLLRYLHQVGRIRCDLAGCVPAVAGWRLAWLPKALEPGQVARLLLVSDTRSPAGLRDAAIVRLLLRLGLRAGDVAALTLDDLDWRGGELLVRGKGRRESRLPLPRDVGRALASYLQHGRPETHSRQVFVRTRAPYEGLSSGGVIRAVSRLLRRAGIPRGAAHLLRHTAATQLLRQGASLPEIGHVLRHRHIDTTAIYAKVDFTSLRALARPWPRGVA